MHRHLEKGAHLAEDLLEDSMCAGPVDFALNSLTSPAMVAATLASLALNGRMAEISKRDIWSTQRVAQERPDVSYKLIAIDFLSPQVPRLSLLPYCGDGYMPCLLMIIL